MDIKKYEEKIEGKVCANCKHLKVVSQNFFPYDHNFVEYWECGNIRFVNRDQIDNRTCDNFWSK